MQLGAIDEGFAEIEAGVNAHSDMDAISYRSFSVSVRIRGLLTTGRFDEALKAVEEGLSTSEQRDERFYLAELLRLKGEALSMTGQQLEAERWLRQAIAVASRQEAKLFELRSAVSLCRLMNPETRSSVVRDLLKPACNWFAEKGVGPDLVEARNLIASTGAQ